MRYSALAAEIIWIVFLKHVQTGILSHSYFCASYLFTALRRRSHHLRAAMAAMRVDSAQTLLAGAALAGKPRKLAKSRENMLKARLKKRR